jgi:hypothetical protein
MNARSQNGLKVVPAVVVNDGAEIEEVGRGHVDDDGGQFKTIVAHLQIMIAILGVMAGVLLALASPHRAPIRAHLPIQDSGYIAILFSARIARLVTLRRFLLNRANRPRERQ